MSRLDHTIERFKAQRACLNLAAARIGGLPGPVFELGLGSGRTYDHLRELLPQRQVFVFDRRIEAHPDCNPDPACLFLGDIRETLPVAVARFGRVVSLIHADIGSVDGAANARLANFLASQLPSLLPPGGLVIANRQEVGFAGAQPIPLPDGVEPGHCFMFQVDGG